MSLREVDGEPVSEQEYLLLEVARLRAALERLTERVAALERPSGG